MHRTNLKCDAEETGEKNSGTGTEYQPRACTKRGLENLKLPKKYMTDGSTTRVFLKFTGSSLPGQGEAHPDSKG